MAFLTDLKYIVFTRFVFKTTGEEHTYVVAAFNIEEEAKDYTLSKQEISKGLMISTFCLSQEEARKDKALRRLLD